jgi:hypothetical protein
MERSFRQRIQKICRLVQITWYLQDSESKKMSRFAALSNTFNNNDKSVPDTENKPQSTKQQQNVEDKNKLPDVVITFVETAHELLTGLHEVFPECEKVKKRLLKFHAFVRSEDRKDDQGNVILPGTIKPEGAKVFVKDWHAQLSNHYDAFRKRDVPSIMNSGLKVLQELDLPKKWADPDFDATSREHLFQFMDSMNANAQLYCAIPANMLNRIERLAQNMAEQFSSGQIDMSTMDPMTLGQQVLDGMPEDEIAHMNLNMAELTRMLTSTMGGAANMDMAGGDQLNAMMKMFHNGGTQ